MDRSRRRVEEASLRWTRRRGLPRAQLQHLQQPRVLRPQPRRYQPPDPLLAFLDSL